MTPPYQLFPIVEKHAYAHTLKYIFSYKNNRIRIQYASVVIVLCWLLGYSLFQKASNVIFFL